MSTASQDQGVGRRRAALGRASAAAVLVNVGGSAIRLVLQIVMARTLGVAAYGQFVLGRSWGELLARLPHQGYETTAVKELPAYERSGRFDLFRGLIRASIRTVSVSAAAITVVGCGIYAALVTDPDPVILLGILLTGPHALTHLIRALLQGTHRFVIGSALIELLHPVVFGLALAGLWTSGRLDAASALIAWIAAMVATAFAGHLVLRRSFSVEAANATPRESVGRWRATRIPLFASNLALVVLDNTDILVVGAMLDSSDVATYAVATRVAVLGRIIIVGVQNVASAHLAAAAATQDWPETQRIVDRSLRICALPSILLTAGAAVFADRIVALFGQDYGPAATLLRILLIGNLVNSITGPSGYVVSLSGLERAYARIMWSAAIAALVLVPLATWKLGAAGAAWGATTVMTAWNVLLLVVARRRLGVHCWVRPATFRRAT